MPAVVVPPSPKVNPATTCFRKCICCPALLRNVPSFPEAVEIRHSISIPTYR